MKRYNKKMAGSQGSCPTGLKYTDPDGEITVLEIGYAATHGIIDGAKMYNNVKKAGELAKSTGLDKGHNDRQDAIRHTVWSAMNTIDFGLKTANEIGNLHEHNSKNSAETAMDLHNNDVGFEIGLNNPDATDDELLNLALEALANGELIIEPVKSTTSDEATKRANQKYIIIEYDEENEGGE